MNVIELVSSIIGSANFQPELVLKLLLRSINLAILKEVLFYSPTSQFIKSKTKVCGFFLIFLPNAHTAVFKLGGLFDILAMFSTSKIDL